MVLYNWEVVTKHACLLGDGPVWDSRKNRIFWIDVLRGEIHYMRTDNNQHNTCKLGKIIGAIAFKKSGGIIAAIKGGFATVDILKGTVQIVAKVETNLPDNRFNDGKCDPAGRFWAWTMSTLNKPHAGSVYVLEKDFTVNTKKLFKNSCHYFVRLQKWPVGIPLVNGTTALRRGWCPHQPRYGGAKSYF